MTVVEFGNFANGIGAELADTSWNWSASHVTLRQDGPNGGNCVRLVGDDSLTFPNQGAMSRIHGIGFKGGPPVWFNRGQEAWRAISYRVPSGFTNRMLVTADEVHGDNGTGPAPLNLTFQRGGFWNILLRGGVRTDGNYDLQTNIGSIPASPSAPMQHFDWVGGNKPVVEDEWIHFRLGWFFETDRTGWFEGWARWGTAWIPIAPRRFFPNVYPDKNGDGRAIAPFMSLYYPTGGGGQQGLDVAAGAWADSYAAVSAWQDKRLGSTGPLPPPATTAELVDKALVELQDATILYPTWQKRVASGYYGTKDPTTATAWGRALHLLDRAKDA